MTSRPRGSVTRPKRASIDRRAESRHGFPCSGPDRAPSVPRPPVSTFDGVRAVPLHRRADVAAAAQAGFDVANAGHVVDAARPSARRVPREWEGPRSCCRRADRAREGRPPRDTERRWQGPPKATGGLRLVKRSQRCPRASRACAGARHPPASAYAPVAALPSAICVAGRPPRDGRAIPVARPAARPGLGSSTTPDCACFSPSWRWPSDGTGALFRHAPRMADGATYFDSHLARRRDARPSRLLVTT